MEITPKAAKLKSVYSSPCDSVESSPCEYKEEKVGSAAVCLHVNVASQVKLAG